MVVSMRRKMPTEAERKLQEVQATVNDLISATNSGARMLTKATSEDPQRPAELIEIKPLRHALKLTQVKFAELLTIAPPTLRKLEDGEPVFPSIAERVAARLNVPIRYLKISTIEPRLK